MNQPTRKEKKQPDLKRFFFLEPKCLFEMTRNESFSGTMVIVHVNTKEPS